MLLEYLSKNMLLDPEYIEIVANSATRRYATTAIKKHDGTFRTIFQPARELKAIQRVIHDGILDRLPIHSSAFAYRKGLNLKDHVNAHKKNNFLARYDFTNFFPSISQTDIAYFINENSGAIHDNWKINDTKLLVKLVCYKGALVIGAVTSPILSNCICYQLDKRIMQMCVESDVKYTRYADDLYFSTNEPNVLLGLSSKLIKILRKLDYPKDLWLNKKKTIHTSKKRLRRITGLILTPDEKVSIGRQNKRVLRSKIHQWNSLSDSEKLSLKGMLSFISSVEPDLINRLCKKFGSKKIYDIIKYS